MRIVGNIMEVKGSEVRENDLICHKKIFCCQIGAVFFRASEVDEEIANNLDEIYYLIKLNDEEVWNNITNN